MEAELDGLFGNLHERVTQQNAKLAEAKNRVAEQEEKMEEMEDTLLALVMSLKELEDAVDAREPLAAQLTEQRVRKDSTTSLEDLIRTNILSSLPVQIAQVEKYATCFGYLWKQSSTNKGSVKSNLKKLSGNLPWNRRWFVMKDDGQVLYYKTMKDATEGKVTPVYLKLRGYQVQEVPEAAKPCAFSLVCGDVGRRPFVLAPERDSESERKRWMDAFTKAIEIHSSVPLEPEDAGRIRSMSSTSLVSSDAGDVLVGPPSAASDATIAENSEVAAGGGVPDALTDAACQGWLSRRVKENVWEKRYYALKAGYLHVLTGCGAGAMEETKYAMRGIMVDILMEDDDGADGKELCFSLDLPMQGVTIFNSEVEEEYSRWFSQLNNASQT